MNEILKYIKNIYFNTRCDFSCFNNDRFCTHDHSQDMSLICNNVMYCIQDVLMFAFPVNKKINKTNSGILGWNNIVQPNRKQAIFWHKTWKENNCPIDGFLFEMRRYSRSEYHKSIKYVVENKEYILKNKIANSMLNSNPKDFWSNVKSINRNKNIVFSGVMDGAVGYLPCV